MGSRWKPPDWTSSSEAAAHWCTIPGRASSSLSPRVYSRIWRLSRLIKVPFPCDGAAKPQSQGHTPARAEGLLWCWPSNVNISCGGCVGVSANLCDETGVSIDGCHIIPSTRERLTSSVWAECRFQQARGIYLQLTGSADRQLLLFWSDSADNFTSSAFCNSEFGSTPSYCNEIYRLFNPSHLENKKNWFPLCCRELKLSVEPEQNWSCHLWRTHVFKFTIVGFKSWSWLC